MKVVLRTHHLEGKQFNLFSEEGISVVAMLAFRLR